MELILGVKNVLRGGGPSSSCRVMVSEISRDLSTLAILSIGKSFASCGSDA